MISKNKFYYLHKLLQIIKFAFKNVRTFYNKYKLINYKTLKTFFDKQIVVFNDF